MNFWVHADVMGVMQEVPMSAQDKKLDKAIEKKSAGRRASSRPELLLPPSAGLARCDCGELTCGPELDYQANDSKSVGYP